MAVPPSERYAATESLIWSRGQALERLTRDQGVDAAVGDLTEPVVVLDSQGIPVPVDVSERVSLQREMLVPDLEHGHAGLRQLFDFTHLRSATPRWSGHALGVHRARHHIANARPVHAFEAALATNHSLIAATALLHLEQAGGQTLTERERLISALAVESQDHLDSPRSRYLTSVAENLAILRALNPDHVETLPSPELSPAEIAEIEAVIEMSEQAVLGSGELLEEADAEFFATGIEFAITPAMPAPDSNDADRLLWTEQEWPVVAHRLAAAYGIPQADFFEPILAPSERVTLGEKSCPGGSIRLGIERTADYVNPGEVPDVPFLETADPSATD